jgi:predicted nuclease of predicted toxin-antitoxin system
VILVADESVDGPVVDRLRSDGHDVLYVAELTPGIDDEDVLTEANRRSATLLTADLDFGELVFRRRLVHSGVILLRLAGLTNQVKAEIVASVLRTRGGELPGAFSVISPAQVRIHRPS